MPNVETRSYALPAERLEYIDRLVASGAYASPEEVVAAGLEALEDRDEDIERWLKEEVAPVSARMIAEPGLAIPAEQVFDEIYDVYRGRTTF